jgi:Poly(ADP-ribose) polymerase catalytic domain
LQQSAIIYIHFSNIGIYFADLSSKSNQYTFKNSDGSCDKHGGVLCTSCIRTMLVCRVALGRQYYPSVPMRGANHPPRGYHSVVALPKPNFLNYAEYVVYSTKQVTQINYLENIVPYNSDNIFCNHNVHILFADLPWLSGWISNQMLNFGESVRYTIAENRYGNHNYGFFYYYYLYVDSWLSCMCAEIWDVPYL